MQGRRLRVTAVEAEPSSVPPPTPDGNITPAPKKPTCMFLLCSLL